MFPCFTYLKQRLGFAVHTLDEVLPCSGKFRLKTANHILNFCKLFRNRLNLAFTEAERRAFADACKQPKTRSANFDLYNFQLK